MISSNCPLNKEVRKHCIPNCIPHSGLDILTLLDYNKGMDPWTLERIIMYRKHLGLTQLEFAALLGVQRNYIHMLEKGLRTPSPTLSRLMDCLEQKEENHGKRNL